MHRKRILFFAEAVTLAHVARPIALASALPSDDYETFIACDPRYQHFIGPGSITPLAIDSISSQQFLSALAKGSPVYDLPTLRKYVEADLALIDRIQPNLVIGDFRLSLSVSARLRGIPYAAISNTYWSPYYGYPQFPLPVLPMTRILPLPIAGALFRVGQKFVFPAHCRPMNQLRLEKGLAPLGRDLRLIYTDADFMLYADDGRLFPTVNAPDSHHVLGPIPWAPPMAVPTAWAAIDGTRPTVYLTLGSSGSPAVAEAAYRALAGMEIDLIVASPAGKLPDALGTRARTFVSEYVPGDEAAARADLVVCNGGSPTSQQALAAGVPVLGIAGNMDQFLNMEALVRAGVGAVMRADRVTSASLSEQVLAMLTDKKMAFAAQRMSDQGHMPTSGEKFQKFVIKTTIAG